MPDHTTDTPTIAQLTERIAEINRNNGWEYTIPTDIPKLLMLCVSELAEAMEADRTDRHANVGQFKEMLKLCPITKSKIFERYIKNSFEDELADAVIRILDLCERCDIDITKFIDMKLEYNKTRGLRHGGKKY